MKLGLGTAAIGRPQYINIRSQGKVAESLEDFRERGMAVLNHAYEKGVRFFDTAPGYGMAEHMLIDWLSNKNDQTIKVASKWGYTYVANFDPHARVHEIKEHSLQKLNEQWIQSQRLLPFLKLYQIHSATLDSGVLENKDIHRRLYQLKKDHQIQIGLTSTGIHQNAIIAKALAICVNGEPLIDSFQVTYNIYDQSLTNILQEIKSKGKSIIIKEALANGRFFLTTSPAHRTLINLSQKYNVGIDAIALRFCHDTIQPTTILSGASNIQHMEANLHAQNFTLAKEDINKLISFKMDVTNYWQERKQLAWN